MAPNAHPTLVVDGIWVIDTEMAGERELNSVYLLDGREPTLVEAGPGADEPRIAAELELRGLGPRDLAHIIVTHVHVDHAGGAGHLLTRYPSARLWVHERGARHMAEPERLVASTARTYGEERMRRLFGSVVPVEPSRIASVADGQVLRLGDRSLRVIHTPGHASHHIAILDEGSGACFTGEAIGGFLPWGPAFRPALPPPEVDVELAIGSIRRIGDAHPSTLLTSHYGAPPDVQAALAISTERIRSWSQVVADVLSGDVDTDLEPITDRLRSLALEDFFEDAGRELGPDLPRYDALGTIGMNAQGLARYWRKRWGSGGT